MTMISWAEKIAIFDDTIIACTLTDKVMALKFDGSYGGHVGLPFTAWSEDWVYFPVVYDGSERVGRAPRNICDHSCRHFGGV